MPKISCRTLMMRSLDSFEVREEGDALYLEGYFAVFNSNYEFGQGMSESIGQHAFDKTIGDDIRCLINHDSTLVLGRTTAQTLELKIDGHGLWGRVLINPNDQDAMNIYARCKRRDVTGCSIGFDILAEETDFNGVDTHWTITELKLYEVSIVTWPAYEQTDIAARQKQSDDLKRRSLDALKIKLKEKLNHAENHSAEIED